MRVHCGSVIYTAVKDVKYLVLNELHWQFLVSEIFLADENPALLHQHGAPPIQGRGQQVRQSIRCSNPDIATGSAGVASNPTGPFANKTVVMIKIQTANQTPKAHQITKQRTTPLYVPVLPTQVLERTLTMDIQEKNKILIL
jgi:hypothetical protein